MIRPVAITDGPVGDKELRTITDAETGELYAKKWKVPMDGLPGRPQGKGQRKYSFFKVYCTNWTEIVSSGLLSLTERGLLMSLMCFVDWESNFLVHPDTGKNLSATEIAELLSIDRSTMMDYLDRLQEKGMLTVVKRKERVANHYILNTNVLFKGNKMKSMREYDIFNADGWAYEAPVSVKYRKSERTDDEQDPAA